MEARCINMITTTTMTVIIIWCGKKGGGREGATNVVVAAGYCVCVRAVGGGRQLTISQDACFL